jgi:hypothetical protein
MAFGEEMLLPVELVTENLNRKDEHISTPAKYVRTLENSHSESYDIVRDVTGKDAIRQKRNYDRNMREINYEISDLVWRNQRQILKGTMSKLARNWTGPWYVMKRLSDVLYQIQLSKQSKPVIIHADNIKQYR